jgi:7,8-dihydro-6-hydroxymethylpterin dimethyltransferase
MEQREQPDAVLSETSALCPTCLRLLPARTVERDGKVWLERSCPTHGPSTTLVVSDAAWWHWSRRFVRPGRKPVHAATDTVFGCPYDCGFCPEHDQHACVTVLEITQGCNLACPACFADSPHAGHASLDDVQGMLDGLLRAEGGEADVVMLSGGEPTVPPRVQGPVCY